MSAQAYKRWICEACGFIYDEARGDPDSGLAPGTRYDDIPDGWHCPLCGMAKSDLVLLPDAPPVARGANPHADKPGTGTRQNKQVRGSVEHVVIVGGGAAGWAAAEALRRQNPTRPVLLVTACKGAVYPKPAISIALSQGKTADDLIDKDAATYAAELGIDVQVSTRILKIDRARKRLVTARGVIEYGKLVLALGANQRQLPVAGNAAADIVSVNDLASYRRFQELLTAPQMHVTILGAGLIGCEFANDLARAGYRVTVVDPMPRPLAALLPGEMGDGLQQRLADAGVGWAFNATLVSIDHEGDRLRATLSNSETFNTSLVLSAAGLVPNVALARKAGLEIDTGIAVNDDMQTSDNDVYAIGDCAAVDGQVYAFIEPIRRQATAMSAHILGQHQGFASVPPLVRIKTTSMPISLFRKSVAADLDWQPVGNQASGLHFEINDGGELLGVALSDELASDAGRLYQQVLR